VVSVFVTCGHENLTPKFLNFQIPMAAQSKALVCGRSLAGIAGSNSDVGMYFSLLTVIF